MPTLKSLVTKLFGADSRLSDLEKIVLDSVRNLLDGRILALWDSQINAINKVQRLPEGVEVNFYRINDGRPSFDDRLAFPNKVTELLLAKVTIKLTGLGRLTATVWCVKGFLFSIEYDGSVSYFEEAAGMRPRPPFDVTCELKGDLAAP